MNTIEQILNEVQTARQNAEQTRKDEIAAYNEGFKTSAFDSIVAWFGDVWPAVHRYTKITMLYDVEGGAFTAARAVVDASEQQLAPFAVQYRKAGRYAEYAVCADLSYALNRTPTNKVETARDALALAREQWQAYSEQQKQKREREISDLRAYFGTYYDERDISEQIEKLRSLEPDLCDELLSKRAQRIADARQFAVDKLRAVAEYRSAYTEWYKESCAITARNEGVIERWRERLSGSFDVTTIRYGLIVDDESSRTVGEQDLITLGQDDAGRWIVITYGGELQHWGIAHVAARREHTVEIGNNYHSQPIRIYEIEQYGVHTVIYAHPARQAALLKQQIVQELREIPAKPKAADVLDCFKIEQIEHEARRALARAKAESELSNKS